MRGHKQTAKHPVFLPRLPVSAHDWSKEESEVRVKTESETEFENNNKNNNEKTVLYSLGNELVAREARRNLALDLHVAWDS